MPNFAVFAHGIYWGIWPGRDAAEAVRTAADDVGTDGNIDGMTASLIVATGRDDLHRLENGMTA